MAALIDYFSVMFFNETLCKMWGHIFVYFQLCTKKSKSIQIFIPQRFNLLVKGRRSIKLLYMQLDQEETLQPGMTLLRTTQNQLCGSIARKSGRAITMTCLLRIQN